MRLSDYEWRLDQEEAYRLFDFGGRTVINNRRPWYEDTDKVAEYCDAEYGAKTFENKEDTKMDLNQLTNNKQAADVERRNIMNELKVGDTIRTSINMTTPMEIFAFDYAHLRVGLVNRISFEGYEKVSRLWVDPLAITDRTVRRVSYADYYAEKRKQKKIGYLPIPKKIIVSEDSDVTVVLWDDNTKTIVKCSDRDQYDAYAAYCAAFAKKCYGTNSQLKKTINKLTVVQESKKKKED